MKKTILLGALMLAAGTAQASGHWYVGLGVGQSKADDFGDVRGYVRYYIYEWDGVGTTDDTSTSWKLFAGYSLNKNFAIEGGYAKLGKYRAYATDDWDEYVAQAKINAFFIDAVGNWPVGQNLNLFGKVGAAYTKTKLSQREIDVDSGDINWESNPSKSKLVPKLGLGASYNFTKNVALRAEYERYFKVGGNFAGDNLYLPIDSYRFKPSLDVWSLGLQVGF